jgi:hypothetical protein
MRHGAATGGAADAEIAILEAGPQAAVAEHRVLGVRGGEAVFGVRRHECLARFLCAVATILAGKPAAAEAIDGSLAVPRDGRFRWTGGEGVALEEAARTSNENVMRAFIEQAPA